MIGVKSIQKPMVRDSAERVIFGVVENADNGNVRKQVKGVEIKRELTREEEREAFLYTSKINASIAFAKYL